jgi:hypothetical protein
MANGSLQLVRDENLFTLRFVYLNFILFSYLAADKTVRIWSTLDGAFEAMLEGHLAGANLQFDIPL